MNFPNFICYLTPVKGNPKAKFAKCGLDHEIEFLKHLESMGYISMVDGLHKPKLSEIKDQKNSIVYLYKEDVKGKRSRTKDITGIPNEEVESVEGIVCVQYYCYDLTTKERTMIAKYIVDKMDDEPVKTKQLLELEKKGCLGAPKMMTCSESNMTFTKTIYPDTKPNPEDFEVVDGKVVEKNK